MIIMSSRGDQGSASSVYSSFTFNIISIWPHGFADEKQVSNKMRETSPQFCRTVHEKCMVRGGMKKPFEEWQILFLYCISSYLPQGENEAVAHLGRETLTSPDESISMDFPQNLFFHL